MSLNLGIGIGIDLVSGGSKPNGNPSALIGTVVSDNQINWTWSNGATYLDGTYLYLSSDGGSTYSIIITINGTGNSYSSTNLTVDYTYYAKVVHFKGTKLSSFTDPVTAKTFNWPEFMQYRYTDVINSEYSFSSTQKALIIDRLSESYVVSTFGYSGANKRECDFFLFFQNSNSSTALVTRTNTKTGATLRWNYGAGNIYSQNDLPAQICDGVVSVTSTDGFSAWTVFNINQNTFIGNAPSLKWLINATTIDYKKNSFDGNIPDISLNTKLVNVYFSENNFTTSSISSIASLTALKNIWCHTNTYLKCTFPSIGTINKLESVQFFNTRLYGRVPDLSLNTNMQYLLFHNTKITGMDTVIYGVKLIQVTFEGNYLTNANALLSTTEVGNIVHNMAVSRATAAPTSNLLFTLRGFGNGALLGDESNADLISLRASFVSASKTLTMTYNAEDSRFSQGYVIFTMDDGFDSAYSKVMPLMQSRGLNGTFYITTDYVGNAGKLTWARIKEMSDAGFDMGSHGQTHASLATLTESQIRAEFTAVDAAFNANNIPLPSTIAYPSGSQNATVRAVAAEFYSLGRGVVTDYTIPTTDKFIQSTQTIDGLHDDEEAIQLFKYIIDASKNGVVVDILYHDVVDSSTPGQFQTNTSAFTKILDYCISQNVNVITSDDLIDIWV